MEPGTARGVEWFCHSEGVKVTEIYSKSLDSFFFWFDCMVLQNHKLLAMFRQSWRSGGILNVSTAFWGDFIINTSPTLDNSKGHVDRLHHPSYATKTYKNYVTAEIHPEIDKGNYLLKRSFLGSISVFRGVYWPSKNPFTFWTPVCKKEMPAVPLT